MKINVHTLQYLNGKQLPLDETYQLPQLVNRNKQILALGPAHFKGVGELSGSILIIRGNLTGTCTLACSRCLAETMITFQEKLEERFNIDPTKQLNDEEGEEIQPIEGNVIDLLPIIEEEVLLSIPNFPVCPEGKCQNEIPATGKGWSLVDDDEQKNKVDPRLADLAKFFEKK